jgi:hypothetical protein
MEEKILELKRLNAAYIAAQEWDYCPEPNKIKKVKELFDTGVNDSQLKTALADNKGRRPDEIAGSMSDLIKQL